MIAGCMASAPTAAAAAAKCDHPIQQARVPMTQTFVDTLVVLVCLVCWGAMAKVELVWEIGDICNGLMAFPNLIALLWLSPVVVKLTKEYFAR